MQTDLNFSSQKDQFLSSLFQKNLTAFLSRYPLYQKQSPSIQDLKVPSYLPELADLTKQKIRLFTVYGLGDPHYLFQLYQKFSQSYFLVVEKSIGRLFWMFSQVDMVALIQNNNWHWLIELSFKEIKAFASLYFKKFDHIVSFKNQKTIVALTPDHKQQKYYKEVGKILNQALENSVRYAVGWPEDHYYGIINTIQNLKQTTSSKNFESYKNLGLKKPGVVVSSGPSLENSVSTLKKIQDKVIIVACDSAVNFLIKENIRIDFITTLERVTKSREVAESIQDQTIPLIFHPVTYPDVLKKYQGPKLYLLSNNLNLGWLFGRQPQSYFVGNSVATMALRALKILGANPCFLFGQDLAFHPEQQKSHVDGVCDFIEQAGQVEFEHAHENQENWVESNSKTKILTTKIYRMIADCFSKIVCESDGTKYYNVIDKKFGMKLPEIEQLEPDQVLKILENAPLKKSFLKQNNDDDQNLAAIFQENIKQNIAGLLEFEEKTLFLINKHSAFYHQRNAFMMSETTIKEFQEYFGQLFSDIEKIFLIPIYDNLLSSFVVQMHLNTFSSYFFWQNKEWTKETVDQLNKEFYQLLEKLIFWARRMRYFFQHV